MFGGAIASAMTAVIAGLLVVPTAADWQAYHDAARNRAETAVEAGNAAGAEQVYRHVLATTDDEAMLKWAKEGLDE